MSKLNKLVTNYPVTLSEKEVENLSATLAPVVAACGGGGGTGGKIYTGIGFVSVNNTTNQIGLTNEANTKLNQDIPTKVSDLSDSANYQTVAGMDEYLTTANAQTLYQTKEAMSAYAKKTELPDSITDFADTNTVIYSYINPLTADIQSQINTKQNKLQFDLNSKGEISAIGPLNNTTALAGANGITGDYYSASNPSGFINSTQAENQILEKHYLTKASGDSLYVPIPEGLSDGQYYAMTTSSWKVIQGAGDVSGISTVAHDDTLTGNGNNENLGVDTTKIQTKLTDVEIQNITDVTTLKTASSTWDNVSAKLNTTDFNTYTATTAPSTYQPIGNYLSSNALDGYATKQWVGQQGYITVIPSEYVTDTELQTTLADYATNTLVQNTSATIIELIPSTANLATETDLQIVSAGVNYVSAHAITAHQSLTDYYKKSQTSGATELSTEFGKYALKSEIPTVPTKVSDLTDSANYYKTTETSSKNEITNALNTKVDKPTSMQTGKLVYDGDTSAWVSMPAGTTTIVQGTNGISAEYDNENTYTVGLSASYKAQIEAVSSKLNKTDADTYYAPLSITGDVNTLTAASASWNNKVDKPTALTNKYLVLRTDSNGDVSGWCDFQDQSYSKSEALGTFVATANIDTTTLSGDGKSVSTKLGVKTDVIATRDYVNSSFLPLSGGTVSGELVVSAATGTFDNSYVKCVNNGNDGYARFGVGSYGGAVIKAVNGNNNVQVNVKYNTNNNELIQVQKSNTDIGFLIPAQIHQGSYTPTSADGILHIILES